MKDSIYHFPAKPTPQLPKMNARTYWKLKEMTKEANYPEITTEMKGFLAWLPYILGP